MASPLPRTRTRTMMVKNGSGYVNSEGESCHCGKLHLPFADAVNRALPHATQVADRYHLVQNLREHVQKFLDHKRTLLPFVEDTPLKGDPTSSTGVLSPVGAPPDDVLTVKAGSLVPDQHSSPTQEDPTTEQGQMDVEIFPLTYAERQKKISRDKRYARYEEVMALYQAGMAQRAIARQLGVSRKLVAHARLFTSLSRTLSWIWAETIWQKQVDPLHPLPP